MNLDFNHLDRVETLLRDCSEAERAGVFSATAVDVAALARRASAGAASPSSRQRTFTPQPAIWRFRWLSAAAAVALAVGVGGWLFSREINQIRDRLAMTNLAAAQSCNETLAVGCHSGPAQSFVAGCEPCDIDHDGDVDLLDRGRLQLAVVAVTR